MVKLEGVPGYVSHSDVLAAVEQYGKTKSVVLFRSTLEVCIERFPTSESLLDNLLLLICFSILRLFKVEICIFYLPLKIPCPSPLHLWKDACECSDKMVLTFDLMQRCVCFCVRKCRQSCVSRKRKTQRS